MPHLRGTRIGIIGVCGVLALGLVVALWWGARSGSEGNTGITPISATTPSGVGADEPPFVVDESSERVAEALSAAAPPLVEESAVLGAQRTLVIGRCVDSHGAAVPQVTVECRDFDASAVSAVDGRFELELDPEGSHLDLEVTLRFRATGLASQFLSRRVSRSTTTDIGAVVLLRGAGIRGRVVDGGGRAIADTRVVCSDAAPVAHSSRQRGPYRGFSEARTEATGAFQLEGVPASTVWVWAHAEGFHWTYSEPISVEPGEEREGIELTLTALELEDTIELTVLRPDGAPLGRAEVHFGYRGASHGGTGSEFTDPYGRYVHDVVLRVPHDFEARDSHGQYAPASAHAVAPGTRDLVLQLTEPRWLELHVRSPESAPVEDFHAYAVVSSGGSSRYRAAAGAPPFAEGVARLMLPEGEFSISIEAQGFVDADHGPFDPLAIESPLEILLERLPSVRGRVTAAGRPVAGAKVGLLAAFDPGAVAVNGFPVRSDCHPQTKTVSAADGTFELGFSHSGRFYLRAGADDWPAADIGPFGPSAEPTPQELEIVLVEAGAVEGRVLLPPGESAAGAIVGYSRGDGCGRTIIADEEGRFRIEGLSPGPWLLELRQSPIQPAFSSRWIVDQEVSGGRLPWSCEVRPGESTRFDLDLRFEPRAILLGSVRWGDAPASGRHATLVPLGRAGERVHAVLDEQGHFRISPGAPGEYALTILGSVERRIKISDELLLTEGDNRWELELPLGRIVAKLPESSGLGTRYSWSGAGALEVSVGGLEPGPDGRVTFDVPAGTGSLESNATPPKVLTVPAGGTIEVDL